MYLTVFVIIILVKLVLVTSALRTSFYASYAVPLHPRARFLTTFCFNNSRFRFTRVPMGLATSPSFLQHSLLEALSPVRHEAFLLWTHIDDILLVDFPHVIQHRLSSLLHALHAWHFTVNYKKKPAPHGSGGRYALGNGVLQPPKWVCTS